MANHYWIESGTFVWTAPSAWSSSSGGPNDVGPPGSTDTAVFDSNSPGSAHLGANTTVGGLSMTSGYTGTIDTEGGGTSHDFTVGGAVTVTGGTLITNSSTVAISGNFVIDGGDLTGVAPDISVTGYMSNTSGDLTFTTLTLSVDGALTLSDSTFSATTSTMTVGGSMTVSSGVSLGTATATLTGTGDLSLGGQTLTSLTMAASGKTTTLTSDVDAKAVTLGTGTLTSSSPSKTLTCGVGAANEKILTNAGATMSSSGGALPLLVLTGKEGCTFDGRSYGSVEITITSLGLAQETAALTCAKLTLGSATGPVNYETGNNNVTVNGTLTMGLADNEATFYAGSSTVTISNGTSTALKLENAISLLDLQSSTWTVTGIWDNSIGGNVRGGSSTVTITNASAIDIEPGGTSEATFNNLTLSGAGAKTIKDTAYIDGNLTTTCSTTVSSGKGVHLGSTSRILVNTSSGSLTMTGDTATGVAAFISGGDRVTAFRGTVSLTNTLIQGMSGTGFVTLLTGTSTLTNCTMYANNPAIGGTASGVTLKNCIIWGRPDQTAISGSPTVTYSDVMGGYSGTGNIDSLPRFLDYGTAGCHLAVDSPCIDTGDPASTYSNEPAPNGSRINMGAYGNTADAQTTQDNTLRAIVNYDEEGNVLASAYGDQTLSLSTYDALSRLTALENGLGEVSYFDYDAVSNQTLQLDPQEQATYFAYDALNRLSSTKAADGGVTSFGYDRVSNRSYAQDPLSNTTYYNYDQLYRVDEIIDPLKVAATYQYDGVGNLIKDTDRVTQVTYFNYDPLYRNTQLAYEAGGEADYTYDSVGNLTASDDMWGQAYFDYDPVNRVTRRQTPEEKVVDWLYQPDSVVDAITYPKAVGTAYYSYDERRRITHVISPGEGHSYFEYTPLDQISSRVFDNGTHSYFEYDAAQRVSEIATAGPTDNALVYFEYGRDTNGDIISMRREDGQTSYYEYDTVRRLTKETIVNSALAVMYGFEYQFDSAGNRTYLKVTAGDSAEIYYEYDSANAITRRHTLTSAAGRTAGWAYYEYNANGSLTSYKDEGGSETSYVWDENQLCKVIVPPSGDKTYFYYDGRLTRYAQDNGKSGNAKQTTYFSWDGINILQFENVARFIGSRHKTSLTHGATPIAGIGSVVEQVRDPASGPNVTRYLHNDHRGTTYKITDDTGAEVWSGLADAYGVELGETGTPDQSIFWYQGQAWYRHEIGADVVYVSPTRIYVPEDGRFIERDPLVAWSVTVAGRSPNLPQPAATIEARASLRTSGRRFALPGWRSMRRHLQDVRPYAGFIDNPSNLADPGGLSAVTITVGTKPRPEFFTRRANQRARQLDSYGVYDQNPQYRAKTQLVERISSSGVKTCHCVVKSLDIRTFPRIYIARSGLDTTELHELSHHTWAKRTWGVIARALDQLIAFDQYIIEEWFGCCDAERMVCKWDWLRDSPRLSRAIKSVYDDIDPTDTLDEIYEFGSNLDMDQFDDLTPEQKRRGRLREQRVNRERRPEVLAQFTSKANLRRQRQKLVDGLKQAYSSLVERR